MSTSTEKGESLEFAVRAIEAAILRTVPAYSDKTFRIESKRVVLVDGVRHEIDVWVEIDLGRGYRSIFVFECKNRKEKVGKNEIIIFSEKINVVQAQRGFFVAGSFTRYAKAQAAKDQRIELLSATHLPTAEIPVPFHFHFLSQEGTGAHVTFRERGLTEDQTEQQLTREELQITLRGEPMDVDKYMNAWAKEAVDARTRTFPSANLPEGLYDLEISDTRHFEIGELILNGRDMDRASLNGKTTVRVIRPTIVSHYEISTRGRALSLAPVEIVKGAWMTTVFAAIS